MQRDNSTSHFILTTIRTFPPSTPASTPNATGESSSPPNESSQQEAAADNATATRPAKPDDKASDAFYRQYDPATGIRTAAMLGGLILLVVVYLLWKSRCRCDVEHESIDFEYWLSKLDQRKAQWVRSKSVSFELPRISVDPLLCASDWVHLHHNHGFFTTQPTRFGNHLNIVSQDDPRACDMQANHSLRPMRGPTFRTRGKQKRRKHNRSQVGDQSESDPIHDVTVVDDKIYLCYFSDEEYEMSMLDSPFIVRRSQSDQDISAHCRDRRVTMKPRSRTSCSDSDHDHFSTAQAVVEVHICPPADDQRVHESETVL